MRHLRQLGAVLTLAVLVVGVPWLFAATIGNPLHGWKDLSAGDLSGTVVIDVLAAVVWIAWAQFTVSVIVEAYAAAGNTRLPSHIPGVFSGQQHLARRLVAAALLVGAVAAVIPPMPHAAAAPAPLGPPTTVSSISAPTHTLGPASQRVHPETEHNHRRIPPTSAGNTTVYVVPSGGAGPDTFWDIAEARLGAGERWHEIWALNEGRTQPDGTVMTDPGLLLPGWTVLVPTYRPPPRGSSPEVVQVVPGDNLTEIADEHDSTEPAVWDLNRGRVMSDGRRFTDADLIKPGDTILIPATNGVASPPATNHNPPTEPPASPPPSGPTTLGRTSPPTEPPASSSAPSRDRPTPSTSSVPASTSSAPDPGSGTVSPSATASAPPATASAAHTAKGADHFTRSVAAYLAVLGGGAGLLAASLYAALRRYRRRQLRHRPAGRVPAPTSPPLQPVDAAVQIAGAPTLSSVKTIDRALRALRAPDDENSTATVPPRLLTLTVDRAVMQLHLADQPPLDPPPPWTAIDADTWQASHAGLNRLVADPDAPAPYPTLVSAVYDAHRETLLHLAEFGAVMVTGDAERATDWLRFIAGELAHNSWSDHLTVTVAGLEPGLVDLNPARLAHTDDVPTAARALDMADDLPEILILGPGWYDDRDNLDAITGRLAALTDPARHRRGPVLIAYLPDDTAAHHAHDAGASPTDTPAAASDWDATLRLHIDHDATLRCIDTDTDAGLVLLGPAPQLSAADAADLAALLASARSTEVVSYVPMAAQPDQQGSAPPTADATPDVLSDDPPAKDVTDTNLEHALPSLAEPTSPAAPAPAVDGTPARSVLAPTEAAGSEVSSLLPAADAHYVSRSATTAADLQFLAPSIQLTVAAALDHDRTLDADLAAWRDPDSPQAKLTLLGPVTLTAHGRLPDGRIAFYTEVVSYLALHRRGVTGDRFAADLWPDRELTGRDSSPKNALSIVRKWLGVDPMSGADYLPVAAGADSPDGVPTYRLSGLLVDWDLFTRLRARAQTRGAGGIADLIAALELVTGEPLGRRRLEGYGWLRDGSTIDEDGMSVAIVDAAHAVATATLAEGDIAAAQHAVDIALSVGPADDRPLLDQAAVLDAQGRHAELAATVRRIRAHHEAEVEEDLPKRTYEILLRRGWLVG